MAKKSSELSNIDTKILRQLQDDGRISYAELARRVGLTTTPCIERVRKLEKLSVITGYQAMLNPEYLDGIRADQAVTHQPGQF